MNNLLTLNISQVGYCDCKLCTVELLYLERIKLVQGGGSALESMNLA